ncbi:MAG TPA: SurA N-terminal domain-containing protein [Burkholderiaceae bacterium]|nr:SurA N-terminal domain-containing protein [Burkholderiaceae bacterium]
MFESVRTHRRWMMLFMLVLIFPSFVFFGIQGYNSFMGSDNALAKVDGSPITQQEFDQAQRDRIERLKQTLGQDFDPKLLETPEARASILDGIVMNRALANEANKANIVVTTDRLRELIGTIPAFQEDGKFSYDKYKAYVASQGMTEAMFEQRVREDLRKQALVQAVVESAVVPKTVANRLDTMMREQREVRELRYTAEQFLPKVKVTDEQVAAFYDKNRALFETPESAKVEFLVLSPDTIAGAGTVPEADARAYYEQNKARYGSDEQRRASHILITPEGGDKAAAKKKAELLLVQVKAKPADFEKLARENSKDPGSAAQGGDLGFFGKGMMVKPFEEAVFRMKPDEISDLVESDFGFHIIKVTEVKAAQVKPFEQVKADIDRDLKTQQAQKEFARAADQFTNLVYEQADSLQPAADALKLKIQQVDTLTRRGLAPFINARIVDALFADESLKSKRNTQAIEVGTNTLVSARIVDYKPAAVRPLDEVKAQVRQLVERREAVRLAKEAGEARLAELRKQPGDAGFAAARTVSRSNPQGLPPGALNAIMRAPADKLPVFVGTDVENAGYLIAQVVSTKIGEAGAAEQREARNRVLAQQAAAADEIAYADGLKARHNVKILKADFQKPAAKPATEDKAAPQGEAKK